MRCRVALGVSVLVAAVALPGVLGAGPAAAFTCSTVNPGNSLGTSTPWPQTQLRFDRAWTWSRGRYVSSGAYQGQRIVAGQPVRIAVIDSGFDNRNPSLTSAPVTLDQSILPAGTTDCVGHGTEVTSIISAQPNGSSTLVGVAPEASVLAIKYTNQDQGGSSYLLAKAIDYAVAQHVRVINLSSELVVAPIKQVMDALDAARRAGIVIVAAAGNDSQTSGSGPFWPAKLSPKFSNIIAVAAVGKAGQLGTFAVSGNYIDVTAPGVDVPVAERISGYGYVQGTSYATPFVTGTVALMLATHPQMTPAEVKNRLEATADPPPGRQPNSTYGWGTINPLLAVTSERSDVAATPSPKPGRPLPVPRMAAAPSRSLQHRAIAIALALLGLGALTVTGAAVLRGNRRAQAAQRG